jgi:hypothetical protein
VSSYFQVPKRLLERLAAGDDPDGFEEDDGELVFDDVGPEVGERPQGFAWLTGHTSHRPGTMPFLPPHRPLALLAALCPLCAAGLQG